MNEYQWLIMILGIVVFIAILVAYCRHIRKTIKLQSQFFKDQVKKKKAEKQFKEIMKGTRTWGL